MSGPYTVSLSPAPSPSARDHAITSIQVIDAAGKPARGIFAVLGWLAAQPDGHGETVQPPDLFSVAAGRLVRHDRRTITLLTGPDGAASLEVGDGSHGPHVVAACLLGGPAAVAAPLAPTHYSAR